MKIHDPMQRKETAPEARVVAPDRTPSRHAEGTRAGDIRFLQRTIGNRAVVQLLARRSPPPPAPRPAPSPMPSPIPGDTRANMERALGGDFSRVTVHAESRRATDLGALAYTQGDAIHFAPGEWSPQTTRGRELLGHELVHVMQQRTGRVGASAQVKGAAINDHASLEAEADRGGAWAARWPSPGPSPAAMPLPRAAPAAGGHAPIQRRVIPVYRRTPASDAERQEDKEQVDVFARQSALGQNAGNVDSELTAGGNLAGLTAPEKLIITGHGNVGTIEGYSGADVAGYLKNQWHLPKGYTGNIHLSSCKAGDSGWFSDSLVVALSNELLGWQATVEGMKGNVVTEPEFGPEPGRDRSVGSDEKHNEYRAALNQYRAAEKKREQDFDGLAGVAVFSKRGAELRIFNLEMELKRLQKEQKSQSTFSSIVSVVSSTVTGKSSRADEIPVEIAAARKEIATAEPVIADARQRVNAAFELVAAPLRVTLNAAGVPFGDAKLTVRHTPQDRNTLANQFSAWVESEIQADQKPAPAPAPARQDDNV